MHVHTCTCMYTLVHTLIHNTHQQAQSQHTCTHTADIVDRMSVWILDGVIWHSQLLSFVLTKSNIQDTTVMIVVDMSQPWTIMESLERWAEVVRKHIQTLQIPDKQLKAMQENCECTCTWRCTPPNRTLSQATLMYGGIHEAVSETGIETRSSLCVCVFVCVYFRCCLPM